MLPSLTYKCFITIMVGYLIGSISPSFILGRLLKGIDIREKGDKNAGTVNTFKVLGFIPALITAIFDLSKGVLTIFISHKIGIFYPLDMILAYSSVLGHIYPFYLKFKGGQGQATSVGVLFYFLVMEILRNSFDINGMLILSVFTILIFYSIKDYEILGIFVIPVLILFITFFSKDILKGIAISFYLLHMLWIVIMNLKRKGYRLKESTRKSIVWGRFFARPFGILYIIIYFLTSKKVIIYITGIVASLFFLFDLIRLSKSGINVVIMKTLKFFLKEKEEKTFSSMTHFTITSFISFIIFPRNVACASILFPIFGDMFAKLIGLEFGRNKIFNKTLEGTLSYLAFSISAIYLYSTIVHFDLSRGITGALIATITEILPLKIDDNISGILLPAFVMNII